MIALSAGIHVLLMQKVQCKIAPGDVSGATRKKGIAPATLEGDRTCHAERASVRRQVVGRRESGSLDPIASSPCHNI